jgi:uncharacterized Zn finger protein (UPF0148 family)
MPKVLRTADIVCPHCGKPIKVRHVQKDNKAALMKIVKEVMDKLFK